MEAVGQDLTPHFSSLIASTERIQQVTQGSQSQLTQLQSDFVYLKNTVVTDLTSSSHKNANGRKQLQAVIGTLHADMLMDSGQGQDSIMTTIQDESSHTRAELASLRDTLLKFMAGNQSAVPIGRLVPSRLSGRDNVDVVTGVGEQPIKTPSSLKDVCEKMSLAEEPMEGHFDRPLGYKKRKSNCTCVRQQSVRGIGPLGISYDFRTPNATKCTYHKSHWKSWRYSLSVRLLPILQKTVEMTFAANFGAGGSSIGPSVRYFGTVERLKSPAFQLLDDFPDRCARRNYVNRTVEGQFLHLDGDYNGFYFDWDLDLLQAEMPELCREISRLLSIGSSAASYSDEYGNTLLHVSIHEIVHRRSASLTALSKALFALIYHLGSNFSHVSDQLAKYAGLVIDAGVQVDAVSQGMACGLDL